MPPSISVPYAKFNRIESSVLGVETGYYELSLGNNDEVETILWLHGSGNTVAEQLRLAAWSYLREGVRREQEGKSLRLIMPTCLPDLFWLNIANGIWKVEDYLFNEILPLAYRESYSSPSERIQVHGYSMGGYASLRLGLKHSDIFKRILAIGPGPLSGSLFEAQRGDAGVRKSIFRNVFGGSEDMYRRCSPYSIASYSSEAIKSNGVCVELAIGENDSGFADCESFYKLMIGLGVDIDLIVTSGVDHRLDTYLEQLQYRLL
jgi:S-formylglutathione hydrolase FrmB